MPKFSYDPTPQPISSDEPTGKVSLSHFLIGAFFVLFFLFGMRTLFSTEEASRYETSPKNEQAKAGRIL
jgi:hypothetical protein